MVCASYSSYCTKMARSRREAEEGEAALVREIRDIKNESALRQTRLQGWGRGVNTVSSGVNHQNHFDVGGDQPCQRQEAHFLGVLPSKPILFSLRSEKY